MSWFDWLTKTSEKPKKKQAKPRRPRARARHHVPQLAAPRDGDESRSSGKLTAKDRVEMAERYTRGSEVSELAAQFGVSTETVRTALKRMGVYRGGRPTAAGSGSELDVMATGLEKVRKIAGAMGVVSGGEPSGPSRPPYYPDDDEVDPEALLRREIALDLARDPEYRKLVREKMMAELAGSRKLNPVQELIERQKETAQLREALGLDKPEGEDMGGFMKAARYLLGPITPLINAWATAAFQSQGGAAPSPTIAQPVQQLPKPLPTAPRPPAVFSSPATAASVPVAPPRGPAAAAVSSLAEQLAAEQSIQRSTAEAGQPQGPPPDEDETVAVINRATVPEFVLFRPILVGLMATVDLPPEEAAQAALDQMDIWAESSPILQLLALALFEMEIGQVFMLASAYRSDPEIGGAIEKLYANPGWCFQWYSEAKRLLAEELDGGDDEDAQDDAAESDVAETAPEETSRSRRRKADEP